MLSPIPASLLARLSSTPDEPLLIQDGQVWSCARVLHRSAGLVHALGCRTGSGPPCIVAVYGNPTLEAIAAAYGILMSGRVLSFFDHQLTAARAQAYARSLRPDWVLCTDLADSSVAQALSGSGARCVALADIAPSQRPFVPARVDARQAAYVLFTSGSTGEPKAACVSYEAAWRAQCAYWEVTGLDAGDMVANEVMPSFDVATFDLFAILRGARLLLPPLGAMGEDGEAFRRHLSESEASVVFTVPSIAEGVFPADAQPALPSLRLLGLTGEAVSTSLTARLRHQLPRLRVHNFFGMTEAPYLLDTLLCGEHDPNRFAIPGDHVRLSLRTDDGAVWPVEVAPEGTSGELVIDGPVLFNGYLDADRGALCQRMVASQAFGDYFRLSADRRLHYLGRRERFAQIWGVRVLLDWVEAVLESHPDVLRAVVMKSNICEELVAVIELTNTSASTLEPTARTRSVAEQARKALDRYQLPARWHTVDAVPLTRTGKKDRRSLAACFDLDSGARSAGW